ncbi:MAG: hypothetical protein U9P10_11760 [Thermodesulfobacteriota bacterium]|nr:hypothetical protein [Thermodesulfobacteriota bacterium]
MSGALNFVFQWGKKARPEGNAIIQKALAEDRHVLLEHEAKQLIKLHGAPLLWAGWPGQKRML